MISQLAPTLFGLRNTNRDFSKKDSWGKNIFTATFPAALCCYLHDLSIEAVYLSINSQQFAHSTIAIQEAFRIDPLSPDAFYAFESTYSPFQQFVLGKLSRIDLVVQQRLSGQCLSALEIKLTALPDNTTCDLSEDRYGSELVVRPDTIVYLACSIASCLGERLRELLNNYPIAIDNWSDTTSVREHAVPVIEVLTKIAPELGDKQQAFLLQPIWKTIGKSPRLADHCLDVFIWSNAGFLHFISAIARCDIEDTRITRPMRTAFWLYKMLYDISIDGRFDPKAIIDQLSFNTKNDKAFACPGTLTYPFMKCARLTQPSIRKEELKKIILNGGQNLLSPERRFDAILCASSDLFD